MSTLLLDTHALAWAVGRPDRLIVAMTHFNFKSIFALNMMFYSGFFAIVAAYLVTLMDHSLSGYNKVIGFLAFFWRLALTTATGSIFGFLVARTAYGSALMAPMFIIYSFAYGLAAFLIVQGSMYSWNGLQLDARILADQVRDLVDKYHDCRRPLAAIVAPVDLAHAPGQHPHSVRRAVDRRMQQRCGRTRRL